MTSSFDSVKSGGGMRSPSLSYLHTQPLGLSLVVHRVGAAEVTQDGP